LQKLQSEANFVEGQADDINEVSDLQNDLHAEFTAAEHAGDLAIVVAWTAIDLVSDQDGPAPSETPHGPGVRQFTIFLRYAFGITRLSDFSQLDLIAARQSATASLFGELEFFLVVPGLLPFFLGPHRERLVHLDGSGCCGRAGLVFEFGDALQCRLQFAL
jgi:hypothetical protein